MMTKKNNQILKKLEGLVYHHTSYCRGYVSRKTDGYAVPYGGRFGKGVAVHIPCYHSTRYHLVQYWVEVA